MRHYLDHAATSWPKSPGVLDAVNAYVKECGAAAGRSSYRSANEVDGLIRQTRLALSQCIDASSANDIAFCSNGTQALNAAIFGIALHAYEQGVPLHVVTTATEHNSVLRPLALASKRGWLTWDAVPCDEVGAVSWDAVEAAIKPETRWLVVNHVSNVTGTVQPIDAWADLAHNYGICLMVDAAQSLGYLPVSMQRHRIDLLASPCHKGLGSLLGCAFLAATPRAQRKMATYGIGGTGSASDAIEGDFGWLQSMESGNLNVPAIVSLHAALHSEQKVAPNVFEAWSERILDAINECLHLRLVGRPTASLEERLPVFSFAPRAERSDLSHAGVCQEWALMLEGMLGIECRAGFHCAGLMHDFLGTSRFGGTVRFSLGHTTSDADVDAACEGLRLLDSAL
ncbi:aminotransferase class V-fold PLP-dependent enzyme [Pirellulaceae bacterium SH501]